jgi:hypothetical protein
MPVCALTGFLLADDKKSLDTASLVKEASMLAIKFVC